MVPNALTIYKRQSINVLPPDKNRFSIKYAGNMEMVFPRDFPEQCALSKVETVELIRLIWGQQYAPRCQDWACVSPTPCCVAIPTNKLAVDNDGTGVPAPTTHTDAVGQEDKILLFRQRVIVGPQKHTSCQINGNHSPRTSWTDQNPVSHRR